MNNKVIKEACIGNLEDAKSFLENDKILIDRIETCSNLEKGGLTPNIEVFNYIKQKNIEQVVMIRNKDTFYIENQEDIKIMLNDIDKFLSLGARNFIFGYLDNENKIDKKTMEIFINKIKEKPNTTWSFHMAIDQVCDYDEAFKTLIDLKFIRVLTKGGKDVAINNPNKLLYLNETYGERIQILVGGKVTKDNYLEIKQKTKINQFHGTKIA